MLSLKVLPISLHTRPAAYLLKYELKSCSSVLHIKESSIPVSRLYDHRSIPGLSCNEGGCINIRMWKTKYKKINAPIRWLQTLIVSLWIMNNDLVACQYELKFIRYPLKMNLFAFIHSSLAQHLGLLLLKLLPWPLLLFRPHLPSHHPVSVIRSL